MALTGRFDVDFEAFYAAVRQASTELGRFEGNANEVQKSLTAMVDTFNPNEVISRATLMAEAIERVGGATKLTSDQMKDASAVFAEATEKAALFGLPVPENVAKINTEITNLKGGLQGFFKDLDLENALKHPWDTAVDGVMAFAESLGPVGSILLGVASGIGVVAKEAFELAAASAEVGEHLGDMSDKTGLSVEALSRLNVAAPVAETSLDALGNALFMFQRGLGDTTGTDKFAEGLSKIGLSLSDIRNLSPDQYLQTLALAFERTADPAIRASAAQDLFKRQGRELLPVLMDLGKAMELTSDILPITPEQAEAAENFNMQIRSLETHFAALKTQIGTDLIPAFNLLLGVMKLMQPYFDQMQLELALIGMVIEDNADAIKMLAGEGVPLLKNAGGEAAKGVEAWHASTRAWVNAIEAVPPGIAKAEEAWREMDQQAKQTEHWTELMNELDSAGADYTQTLDTMNGEVVEAVAYYLQAGVSQRALAEAYSLTATQVRAVATALKEEKDAQKLEQEQLDTAAGLWDKYNTTVASGSKQTLDQRVANAWAAADAEVAALERSGRGSEDAYNAIYANASALTDNFINKDLKEQTDAAAKLWEDYEKEVIAGQGKGINTRLAQIDQWAAAQKEALTRAGKDSVDAFNAIDALAEQKKQNETNRWLEQDKTSRQYYVHLADAARSAYDDAKEHADQFTKERLDQLEAESKKADDTLSHWQDAANKALKSTANAADDARGHLKGLNEEFEKQKQAFIDMYGSDAYKRFEGGIGTGVKLPGSNVETDFGQSYLIGPNGQRIPLGPHGELPSNWSDMYAGGSNFPGYTPISLPVRAAGGPVTQGQPYLVGEQGPELFVPNQSGGIVPNGGGPSIVNNITLIGTPEDLVRRVKDELTRTMLQVRLT